MRIQRYSILVTFIIVILLQSCGTSTTTEPPATASTGAVNLSIQLGNIGNLSKSSVINLASLNIEFSSSATVVYDTVTVSGNAQVIVSNSYTDLSPGAWSVRAETRDVNDMAIHIDSTTFTVTADANVDVSLSLTAKYSMLLANFVALADSVSRCELLVDATLVADSSFAANSEAGSTISLAYDYLSTGEPHAIKLDVYGVMWGTESLLYTGDSTITVAAGSDDTYTIDLLWVGPNEAPNGSAAVEIIVGRAGTVTMEGVFPTVAETVTDIDGNVYNTVTIGNQVWMTENLKVTHFQDGSAIINVTDHPTWASMTTAAYSIYNDNASNEVDIYGVLYNWYAVTDSRNIAPAGWHTPSDDEWKELEMTLGMSQSDADGTNFRGTNEGSKLAGSADLWNDGALENDSEFTSSSFSAVPGGRHTGGGYSTGGNNGYFWSASEDAWGNPWERFLGYWQTGVNRNITTKSEGLSVRCLKD